ncbi:ABC transporter substrate-binding protein [Paractinoplanes globisporus]|uniref:ABC transporter substrate-binding protein n=1 Tax=Paractinoplanes globisporus TaxID=113565 RepID=A0ABW6WP95_9ACTN|nr:sugar ABC transporter substrate-binding protein [Actinoplanes globisporus]
MRISRAKAVVGIAALVLLAAGCGSGDNGTGGTGSDVTLTVSRWAGPAAEAEVQLLKDFTKQTGIKVRVDAIDYAQLKQKQTLAAQNKTGDYDLLYVPEAWYQEYNKAGYLVALDQYLDAADKADFNSTALDITSSGGKIYGLPDFLQSPLLVYNKDEFAAKNVQVPKNWDELLAAAKVFKDKGTGIAFPGRQGSAVVDVLSVVAKGDGGGLFDAGGKLALTSQPVVDSAAFLTSLMKQSLDGSAGWHYDETTKAVQFGQAPLAICVSGLFSVAEDPAQSKVAGKLGYAPIPYQQTAAGLLATWSYSIPVGSKHEKEAYQLASWLTSKDTQVKMIQAFPGHLSLRTSVFDDPSLAAKAPWLPAVKETLANATTPPLSANGAKLTDALGAGMNGLFVKGGDPAQMLQSVQQQLASDF